MVRISYSQLYTGQFLRYKKFRTAFLLTLNTRDDLINIDIRITVLIIVMDITEDISTMQTF